MHAVMLFGVPNIEVSDMSNIRQPELFHHSMVYDRLRNVCLHISSVAISDAEVIWFYIR